MGKRLVIRDADFSANAIDNAIEYELVQGYASPSGEDYYPYITIGTMSTRVRTGEIYGSYKVKTNPGFVIRAIVVYKPSITPSVEGSPFHVTSRESVSDVQGMTEYVLNNPDAYSIITFCKTDATQDLSPMDDIVAKLKAV